MRGMQEYYPLELGPGHVRVFRDPAHPELVAARRPGLRHLFWINDIEATDDEIDHFGSVCAAAGVSAEGAIQLVTAYRYADVNVEAALTVFGEVR